MKRAVAVAVLSICSGLAAAQSGGMKGMDMKRMDMPGMDKGGSATAESHRATGTVKSVDAAKGTVTLNHQPVTSLGWPAMTMTFKTKDAKILEGIKPGQKVDVDFRQQGKDYVITRVR